MKTPFSFVSGALLLCPVRTWLASLWLVLLASMYSHAPPPPATLTTALAPDGTLRPGTAGSFDTKGFELFTAPDGRPVFRPAKAKCTQGAGDEKWQQGFGLLGTNGTVYATVVAANGDVYIGGLLRPSARRRPVMWLSGTARLGARSEPGPMAR